MRAIKFCRNVNRQTTTLQSLSRVFSVRRRGQKISAQRKKQLRVSFVHRLNRMDRIESMMPWRTKPKFLFQAVEELRGRLLPNSHCAITLHVAVPAHRTQPTARLAELAAQHHQIDDLLDVCDRIFMLRQSHGPTEDYSFRCDKDARRIFELCLADSGLLDDIAEMGVMQCGLKFLKPRCVTFDEFMIENFAGSPLFRIQHFFHQSFEQSYVAVDTHLQEQIGELGSRTEPCPKFLRM